MKLLLYLVFWYLHCLFVTVHRHSRILLDMVRHSPIVTGTPNRSILGILVVWRDFTQPIMRQHHSLSMHVSIMT